MPRRRPTRRRRGPLRGTFWPSVREMIWRKAEQLYAAELARCGIFIDTPPTREELRELGYFDEAKVLVLRELRGAGAPPLEEGS